MHGVHDVPVLGGKRAHEAKHKKGSGTYLDFPPISFRVIDDVYQWGIE